MVMQELTKSLISQALSVQESYFELREENIELKHRLNMLEQENRELAGEVLGGKSLTEIERKLIEYAKDELFHNCFGDGRYGGDIEDITLSFEEFASYNLVLYWADKCPLFSKQELFSVLDNELKILYEKYLETVKQKKGEE